MSMKRREFTFTLAAGTGSLLSLALAGCKGSPAPAAAGASAPAVPAPAAAPTAASAPAGVGTAATPAANPAPAAPTAPAGSFVAGTDYAVLAKPVNTDATKGQVEVLEFFGYWCPHCNHFEPEFDVWIKAAPKHIVVRRVPMAFRPEMAPLQRLYYALQALGKVDEVHGKVFDAIHKDKQQLFSDEAVLAWAAKQPELGGDKFEQAYKSFGMAANLSRANQMMVDYGVEGVPSLGVAGKYYVDGEHAKGMTRALQIVTALAQQEAKQ